MADHPPHQQHPIPPTSPALSAIPSAFSSPARSSSHDQSSMMGASTSSRPTTTGGGGGGGAPAPPPPPRRQAPPPLSLSTPLATTSRTHPHQYQHTHTQQHLHPPSSTTAARLSSSMKGAPSPMRVPIVTPMASSFDDKNVLLQIHYGTRIILRGPKGATLTAKSTINTNPMLGGGGDGFAEPTTPTTPSSMGGGDIMHTGTTITTTPGGGGGGGEQSQQAGGVFKVCTEGRGLGEPSESFMLINCNKRDDKGPIAYNQVVAIRCSWANERFLAADNGKGGGLGIWRTLIGSDEKWIVRRPDLIKDSRLGLHSHSHHHQAGVGGGTSSIPGTPGSVSSSTSSFASSTNKSSSAPGWVHAGDPIILQSNSNTKEWAGRVLVIRESPHVEGGSEVILCPPESAVLAQATWLMGWAGTPLYPAWNVTRPYLTSGEFLLHPNRHNLTPLQEEAFQVLPHSTNRDEGRYAPKPLAECSAVEQERLLVEDLLWVVYGYEGKYIKAQSMGEGSSSSGSNDGSSSCPSPLSPAPSSPNSSSAQQQDSLHFTLPEDERSSLDPSLASMVTKFLPLGQQCLTIRRFVDTKRRYDYGIVAQALSAALQDLLLKPYTILLAQLEHKLLTKNLTLQQLFFHLQPSFYTLSSLATLCTKVHRLKGGALLNCIRESGIGGDEKHTQMHAYLLEKAAAPYMVMLEGWIYQGKLDDPYHEFMVREELSLSKENVQEDFNAAYWDARSTVRKEHVLEVLGEWEGQILTTGKYLNVIRECGQNIGAGAAAGGGAGGGTGGDAGNTNQQQRLRYGAGKAALGEAIDAAYRRACQLLLDVVLRQHRLLPRLTSIKHYFLLDTGDFFVHFMNNAERELLKDMGEVSPSRLEGLLHLSIQMSVASNDPYKDDVTSVLNPMKLIEHLNAIHKSATGNHNNPSDGYTHGVAFSSTLDTSISFSTHTHTQTHTPSSSSLPELPSLLDHLNLSSAGGGEASISGSGGNLNGTKTYEALMLDCQVKWPLCLVISRRTLTKYQLLFRHLFLTKFVERRLHTSWAEQQSMKELDVRGALGLAFVVRQKMQHFMENYIYYMMFEVIEPHWLVLCEALKTGEGVEHLDDVIRLHHEFQDSCLKECLLTTPGLLKILNKIVVVCVLFAAYMEQAMREFETGWYVDEDKERKGMAIGIDGSGDASSIPATDDTHTHNGAGGKKKGAKTAGGGVSGSGGGGSHDSGAARRQRVARQTDSVQRRAKLGAFTQNMEAFAKNVDFHLQEFMCGIWKDSKNQSNAHLNNLIQRLDYSGYFRAQFEGKRGGGGGGNGVARMMME